MRVAPKKRKISGEEKIYSWFSLISKDISQIYFRRLCRTNKLCQVIKTFLVYNRPIFNWVGWADRHFAICCEDKVRTS